MFEIENSVGRAAARIVVKCASSSPTDRFDVWADAVNRSFVPLSAFRDRHDESRFDGQLVAQTIGQSNFSTVDGSAVHVRRTKTEISASDPGFVKVGLQLRGYSVIEQDGRDAALAPGDFALYDTTRPYTLNFDASFRMFVVMFPPEALRLSRDHLRLVTASRFSGRSGTAAITSQLLAAVGKQLLHDELRSELPLSDAIFDLLRATLAERLDDDDLTDVESRRRVLLTQVRQFIAEHLGDPDLTVQGVADAHHVSLRYLQKLFSERGETASSFIRLRRLEQSRRDIATSTSATAPISSIGARWGFADATAFARAFRTQFGVTPSEYRASSVKST